MHGHSRWVAPTTSSERQSTSVAALRDALIYELHVGTFTREGTFVAATAHLDHLVELGVTHVELMPSRNFRARTAGATTA